MFQDGGNRQDNMAGTAAVFLDGGYLDKVLAGRRIDFARLAIELAEPDEVLRTYYYHSSAYFAQAELDRRGK